VQLKKKLKEISKTKTLNSYVQYAAQECGEALSQSCVIVSCV
jgi:vacuolar-type H+-ATPase subunit E/Vma4